MATFKQAAAYVMPIGKYRGQALDKIAWTDSGLAYLRWLRDERNKGRSLKSANDRELDDMLAAYLDDPTIAKE